MIFLFHINAVLSMEIVFTGRSEEVINTFLFSIFSKLY